MNISFKSNKRNQFIQHSLSFAPLMWFIVVSYLIIGATPASSNEAEVIDNVVIGSSEYMQLKPTIITNYEARTLNYVRADVAIRVKSNMITNIKAHIDPIRDIIIMLLARQNKDTLTSSEGISAIREEAKGEIIAFLESEGEPTDVMEVLFMSFLVE